MHVSSCLLNYDTLIYSWKDDFVFVGAFYVFFPPRKFACKMLGLSILQVVFPLEGVLVLYLSKQRRFMILLSTSVDNFILPLAFSLHLTVTVT